MCVLPLVAPELLDLLSWKISTDKNSEKSKIFKFFFPKFSQKFSKTFLWFKFFGNIFFQFFQFFGMKKINIKLAFLTILICVFDNFSAAAEVQWKWFFRVYFLADETKMKLSSKLKKKLTFAVCWRDQNCLSR